jgi:hypothetical protein
MLTMLCRGATSVTGSASEALICRIISTTTTGSSPVLQASYSAKEGRPVACRQTHLIELANTLFNSYKRSLWVFSVMMGHYDRAALMLARGSKEAWLGKVRRYYDGWLNNDPEYAPDREDTCSLSQALGRLVAGEPQASRAALCLGTAAGQEEM